MQTGVSNEPHTPRGLEGSIIHSMRMQTFLLVLSLCGVGKKANTYRREGLFLLGLFSLFWFLFRSGTKPTRVVYPCQRVALDNMSLTLSALVPVTVTPLMMRLRKPSVRLTSTSITKRVRQHWKPFLVLAIIVPFALVAGGIYWASLQSGPGEIPEYPDDVNLVLDPLTATNYPSSSIYVVNGRDYAHISNLITLMGTRGLYFYQTNTLGDVQGPSGLIAHDDVVLIKINSQWSQRGGTNTDILKELIQTIVNHPDGFTGEIIVADNGQGFGNLDWRNCNAENTSQSAQDVVDMFSSTYQVSAFDWQPIRGREVDEYSDGDMTDGYILYHTPDPETGLYVSYPKFQTDYGTYISFRNGIWNGVNYETRLKVINFPVLKSHVIYGVTGACKHYMGVQSEGVANAGGLANGHSCVATGGMGTLIAEVGLPTLNIMDAIWVNANPFPQTGCGPSTNYAQATRINVLLASRDPVALDYWAAKYVLMPTAELTGWEDVETLDPDWNQPTGLLEEFGVWLDLTHDELLANGYQVTNNQAQMSVFIEQASTINILQYREIACSMIAFTSPRAQKDWNLL